jgi:hypothetical protein
MTRRPETKFEGDEEVLLPDVSPVAPVIGCAPTNTFLGRAVADLNGEAQGRFGVAKAPATIVGLTPTASMPGTAPQWSKDGALLGDEPPLGIAVDELEPRPEDAGSMLRRHAGELSRLLGSVDAFWQDRLGKLIDTMMLFGDQIDGVKR